MLMLMTLPIMISCPASTVGSWLSLTCSRMWGVSCESNAKRPVGFFTVVILRVIPVFELYRMRRTEMQS